MAKTVYAKFLAVMTAVVLNVALCPVAKGFAEISGDKNGKEITLCIPDSLLGRSVVLSTKIVGSSSKYPLRMSEVGCKGIFTITRVDSSIVIVSNEKNSAVTENSSAGRNEFVLEITGKTDKGYSVKAGKLFDLADKKVANLKGLEYGPYAITDAEFQKSKSKTLGFETYGQCVAVRTDATFSLKLRTTGGVLSFEMEERFPCTMEMISALTLLPESTMAHKKADPRIGTLNYTCPEFSSTKGSKAEKYVCRWDLSGDKTIDIYIDTLLSAAQNKAVRQGFEAWNDAFEAIGMGRRIRVADYPADSSFKAYDPTVSIVSLSGWGTTVYADILNDGKDRIVSTRYFIPDNYVSSVRRRSVFTISDVDPRYRKYHLDEDAVCDVLKADIIRFAGHCLGIASNYAGSAAYSPQQLRDPGFTQKYGFTASVTDDVLFNYLAMPGDKEKGVATIVDKVGEYDIYALRWIYSDGKVSTDPHLFYAPSKSGIPDPRVKRKDLSNDSKAAFEAGVSHIRFVAENGAEWIMDDDIPEQEYRQLFLDWLWLRGAEMVNILSADVGAFRYNLLFEDSEAPKYEPLSKELQKQNIEMAFDFYRNFGWLDKSPLLHIAGLNVNTSDYTRANAFNMINASFRFQFVAMAQELAGSSYSVREYLEDMERQVFKVASEGRLPYGETFIIPQYINWLASNAGIKGSIGVDGVSEECRIFLERAGKKLKQCRSAMKTDEDRDRMDYIIHHYGKLTGK